VRVFVADAQPLFRQGVRLTLEAMPDIAFVGEADSGRDALQQLEGLGPHVCLVDAHLPLGGPALGFGDPTVPSGIELGRLIKHRSPDVGVVIIATYEDEEQLFQAMKVGAAAYCQRDIGPDDLVGLIRDPWVGGRPFLPDGLPVIDRLPDDQNVFVATGHGMLGVTLGPATGAAVAELVTSGGAASPMLHPFRLDRQI
jgi:DNA-binding NarL/FixJ family response regulator